VGQEIFDFIGASDLSGFNALKFDIPMLMEEFLRLGLDFDLKAREIIDVQIIFHKMEERTLSAAYRFYCNQELVNAHSAEADTIATYEVFKAQLERYTQLQTDVKSIGEFTGLNKRVDLEGRILLNQQGEEIFNFGKHKGRTVEAVFTAEPTYYNWMMDGEFSAYTKKIITDIRLRMLKKKFQG
jgi:DNA polymerase-3 subunit epsilon